MTTAKCFCLYSKGLKGMQYYLHTFIIICFLIWIHKWIRCIEQAEIRFFVFLNRFNGLGIMFALSAGNPYRRTIQPLFAELNSNSFLLIGLLCRLLSLFPALLLSACKSPCCHGLRDPIRWNRFLLISLLCWLLRLSHTLQIEGFRKFRFQRDIERNLGD